MKIELYGVLREAAGTETVNLPIETPCRIADALDVLVGEHPAIEDHLPRVACAVDDELRTRQDTVHDGETLVLLPPVSGG
ncbi:MoaD/ThiS family protein [Spiribacter vilamensis]|uniref:Molybdopterin synthase sulfur carrier subunit n=1 Tax=Spiribacter vilamensis TaxID=531306 RepID=A0A4Q8D1A3_9GAMM|nr:MoaD/ThiS family protein [Spiribacter vilamensis]RZU99161.1 molybdopterin synthase sulfur carrier subunit [Spiribacter vilamensis]TVO61848.1 MoaD/ThiS family protein [Spiribacter vilamensis]